MATGKSKENDSEQYIPEQLTSEKYDGSRQYKTKFNDSSVHVSLKKVIRDEFDGYFIQRPFNRLIVAIVCLITFIYGFIYILAFFNPYERLANVPMAVINNDQNVCMIYKPDPDAGVDQNDQSLINAKSIDYDTSIKNQQACQLKASLVGKVGYYTSVTDQAIKNLNIYNQKTNQLSYKLSVGNTKIDYIKGSDGFDQWDDKYWVQFRIPAGFTEHLTTLFVDLNKAENMHNSINGSEYDDLTELLAEELKWFADDNNKAQFWGTYRQNFVSGEIANFYAQISSTLLADIVPNLMSTVLFTLFSDFQPGQALSDRVIHEDDINRFILGFIDGDVIAQGDSDPLFKGVAKEIGVQPRARALDQVLTLAKEWHIISPTIKTEIYNFMTGVLPVQLPPLIGLIFGDQKPVEINTAFIDDNTQPPFLFHVFTLKYDNYRTNLENIVDQSKNISNVFNMPFQLAGQGDNSYGIGLGQSFVVIAIWIGIFASTIIYNRRSRTSGAKFYQYYITKMITIQCTTFVQTTILMIALLGLGFSTIGISYLWLYLFMLFAGFVFTFIITGIWFAIPDELTSRIVILVFLMLNFAAGWILFPSFMSAGFYDALSHVMPMTYVMHNNGDIVYALGAHAGDPLYYIKDIILNCVYLLVFAVVFAIVALVPLYYRFLKARYGTRCVRLIFKAMDRIPDIKDYIHRRSVLLILTSEQKDEIRKQVQAMIAQSITDKYSFRSKSRWERRREKRNSIS